MEIVGDCLVGHALEALSFGLEQLIGNNAKFKSLSTDIKSKLDTLRPIIQDMVQCNEQSNFPEDPELRDLQVVMEKGAELVDKCSKLPIWRVNKKFKYTNRLCDWNESLEKQLSLLKLRGLVASTSMLHDIRSAVVKRNQPAEVLCAVPELPKVTVGLEVPLQELKAELLKEEVAMVVVTAPRGCGKTTLVTNFCQHPEVKDKFKNNIFFVTVSRKPNLELIMKELYGRKGYQVPTFQVDEAYGYKWLQKVIEEEGDNPLLLVLDDVWSGSEYFLEKFEFKLSNYKVLVTARCDFRRFGSSYLLPLLDDHNAMKLFHHTASLGDKSSHIPKYISKEIVNHCNGFPLAITVVGRSLCGQPIEMWQSRLSKWSEEFSILDSETELLLRLQSSIDAIDDEIIKKCFLDLGSFSEDSLIPIAVLIDMWTELYDLDEDSSCVAILYELRNRSLVSLVDKRIIKVDGDGDYSCFFVKQHDLLRELAIYQSKQNCIEHRERVLLEMCGDNQSQPMESFL